MILSIRFLSCLLVAGVTLPLSAHEMRPAYLEISEISPETYEITWKVPARGGNQRLSMFVRFDAETEVISDLVGGFLDGAYVERWRVKRPEGLSGTSVYIDGLAKTFTDVLVRVSLADTETQTVLVIPEKPHFVIAEVPTAWAVAQTYTRLGAEHILEGIDHLLFVLALLILVSGFRRLITTVTAFTIAHSLTLAGATLGFIHVPGPPVEAVIALSIVFVAFEIIRRRQGKAGITERSPWIVAFTFGLLHGFGFAGALNEVGLPQSAIPVALLFFNVGVEFGQLLFIAAVILLIALTQWINRRIEIPRPSWAWRIPPYAIGGLAMFWLIERVAAF